MHYSSSEHKDNGSIHETAGQARADAATLPQVLEWRA
jgi:hypothetical protein